MTHPHDDPNETVETMRLRWAASRSISAIQALNSMGYLAGAPFEARAVALRNEVLALAAEIEEKRAALLEAAKDEETPDA
jgi:hypothetical protein